MAKPWTSMCVNGHQRAGNVRWAVAVGKVASYRCIACETKGSAGMRWSVPPDVDYDTQLAYAKLFASRQQETS